MRNLKPWETGRHREQGRWDWQKKSMTHAAAVKMTRKILRRRVSKKPAGILEMDGDSRGTPEGFRTRYTSGVVP